jgi:hypothetical protein
MSILNIEDIADEINGLETGKKEADFKIAELAKRASKELSAAQKKELYKKLNMSKYKFSNYVFIGGRLSELEPIIQHLPEGYTLLDAIARLSVTERNAALEAGVINPKMTRAQLKTWRAKRAGKEVPNRDEHRTLGSVVVNPKLLTRRVLEQIWKELDSLRAKYGCEVKLFCHPSDDELDTAWKKRTRYVVQAVKRIVAEQRRQAYKKAKRAWGVKKLTEEQKSKLFAFVWDEVHLDGNSDEEDAQRVLETLQRADEFEPICREADDLYDPGAVEERKTKLFAQKEDDDESDGVKNIKPVLAKAKARVQSAKKPRKREQKKKKAA